MIWKIPQRVSRSKCIQICTFIIKFTPTLHISCVISEPGPNQYLDTGSMGVNGSSLLSSPPRFSSFFTPRLLLLQLGGKFGGDAACPQVSTDPSFLLSFLSFSRSVLTERRQAGEKHAHTAGLPRQNKTHT